MTKKFVPFMFATLLACNAAAQTSVGVSVGIYQPGVYGRIDIGNYPPPPVIYPQPVVIAPGPVAVYQQPIYLYVPPGHQKNWGKYCSHYAACGQRVYFVQERWIEDRTRSTMAVRGGKDHGNGRKKGPRQARLNDAPCNPQAAMAAA